MMKQAFHQDQEVEVCKMKEKGLSKTLNFLSLLAESGDSAGAAGPGNRERLQRLDSILNENDDHEIFTYFPSAEERER